MITTEQERDPGGQHAVRIGDICRRGGVEAPQQFFGVVQTGRDHPRALGEPGASIIAGLRNTLRVLLAEDVLLVRTALARVLAHEDDIELVAEVPCDDKVVSLAIQLYPDVAIVAVDDPAADGMAVVHQLRSAAPHCQIVALTASKAPHVLKWLVDSEVSGLVDKDSSVDRLLQALRAVGADHPVVDAQLAVVALSKRPCPLTPREYEVLQLAAAGLRSADIAAHLALAPGTVRNHTSAILRKTGARNQVHAIRIATEHGWVANDPARRTCPRG